MSETGDANDEGARCRAVEALAGLTDDAALAKLLDASRDDSWRVRERAVRLLTRFSPERLVEVIADTVNGAREPSVRNAAMDALVRLGPQAVTPLSGLLEQEHWELRLHGAVTLGRIAEPQAVSALARLLKDSEENVIHAAAEALGQTGSIEAVGPLVEVLRTSEFWSQYPAVVALGRIGHHSATETLLEFIDDEMLAPAIVDALGLIADPRALQPMLRLLEADGEPLVPFEQVFLSLVRLGHKTGEVIVFPEERLPAIRAAIQAVLGGETLDDRLAALVIAGWTHDPLLVPIVLPYLSEDSEHEAAYQALQALGSAAGPHLIGLLDASQPNVRRAAIRLLSEFEYGLEEVLRHIIDPDEAVRMEVALAVGRSGKTELTEYLFEMLLDESEDVRRVALEVLSGFRTDGTVREQLYHRLEYYPDNHLPIIIETLGRVDVVDALPRLEPLMTPDHDEQVRAAVVRAVRRAGVAEAVALLLRAADDSEETVRAETLRSLAFFKADQVFDAVAAGVKDTARACAYAAVGTLGALGDSRAVPILESVVRDENIELGTRVEAVRSLGALKADESAGALVELLDASDDDVRREVVKALGCLKGGKSHEGLVKASLDPFWAVRATAASGLAGREQALPHILRLLDDADPLVRKAAVRALREAGPSYAMRLVPLLGDDEVEDVVAAALEDWGPKAVPFLAEAPVSPDPTLRLRIARVLARIRGDEAEALLRTLANDSVAEVSAVARHALAEAGGRA